MRTDLARLRRGRNAGGAVAVLSFLTLAVLLLTTTLSARDVALQKTFVPAASAPEVPAPTSAPSVAEAPPAPPAAPPVDIAPAPQPVAAVSTAPVTTPHTTAPKPVRTTSAAKPPAAPTSAPGGASERATATCPAPLPAPQDAGGLAELVSFAPAFGPFAAEAFALAPAYAPFLELVGPFLAAFSHETAQFGPQYAPLITALQLMSTQGYNALAPLYAPFRGQLLNGATSLAAGVSPGAQAISRSQAAACLIDLEGLLTAQVPAAG